MKVNKTVAKFVNFFTVIFDGDTCKVVKKQVKALYHKGQAYISRNAVPEFTEGTIHLLEQWTGKFYMFNGDIKMNPYLRH